jgi:hypothetical protein
MPAKKKAKKSWWSICWKLGAVALILILVIINQTGQSSHWNPFIDYPQPGKPISVVQDLIDGPHALVVSCESHYPQYLVGEPQDPPKCNRDGSITIYRSHDGVVVNTRVDQVVNLDFLPVYDRHGHIPGKSPDDMHFETPYSATLARLQVYFADGNVAPNTPCPDVAPNGTIAPETTMPVFCLKTDHTQVFTVRLVCNGPHPGTPCGADGDFFPQAWWHVELVVHHPEHPSQLRAVVQSLHGPRGHPAII